jgi:hypothetical protein
MLWLVHRVTGGHAGAFDPWSPNRRRSRWLRHLKGLETMRPLLTVCAEDFVSRRPHIAVLAQGGGSGVAIAALLQAYEAATQQSLSGYADVDEAIDALCT